MASETRWIRYLLVGVIALGACSNSDSDGDIEGVWQLISIQIDDGVVEVEVGMNTPETPWIEFDDQMTGNLGCNGFGGSYEYDEGLLVPGEVFRESGLCLDSGGMTTEDLIQEQFFDRASIGVSVTDDEMTWEAGGSILVWSRIDGPPPEPPLPRQTSIGPLECGENEVLQERVEAEGFDFASFETTGQSLTDEFPEVVDVEQSDPASLVWYGYDGAGAAVVVVSCNDDGTDTFTVATCP